MKRKPLHVNLHATEPSIIEVTVGDRVQIDRLTPSPGGNVRERHGRLLGPGVTTVALAPGHYFFRTLSDTHLRVVTGGITAGITQDTKTLPPPPATPTPDELRGDDAPGELPSLTIE
jgi:hypothetical protein